MTDEQVNEAIFRAKGWMVVIPDTLWTRGTCKDNDIEDTRDIPDYTHDWRLVGQLYEELIDGGYRVMYYTTNNLKRLICEAWLAWKEQG